MCPWNSQAQRRTVAKVLNVTRVCSFVLVCIAAAMAACQHSPALAPASGTMDVPPTMHRLPPLDASKLHSASHEIGWGPRIEKNLPEFADEKNGVFVHVEQRKWEGQPFWGHSQKGIVEHGVQWVEYVDGAGDRVRIVRLRCTPETWRYILQTPETPAIARFMATRDIYKINEFVKGERLALIELASRDVIAGIRRMAVIRAADFVPQCEAVPILCRALCDPNGEVAEVAGKELVSYFFPRPAGEPADPQAIDTIISGGSAEEVDERYQFICRREALSDARRIHEVRPDLVTDEDLATIERLLYSPMVDSVKRGENKPEAKLEAKPDAKPDAKPAKNPGARNPKAESK